MGERQNHRATFPIVSEGLGSQSSAVCPQMDAGVRSGLSSAVTGEEGGSADIGAGHRVAAAVAPAACSPLRRAGRSPARLLLLPSRPPSPVLRHRSPAPAGGVAAAPSDHCLRAGTEKGKAGRPPQSRAAPPTLWWLPARLPPRPRSRSRLPPALRSLAPRAGRAHTHSRAPPRLPAGGGWGRLRPLPPLLSYLRGHRDPKPQSRRRSRVMGAEWGREAGPPPGWGRLPRLWAPGERGQARSRPQAEAVAMAGAGGRAGRAGDRARGCRRRPGAAAVRAWRGAERSGRPNLPRKLTK